MSYIRFNERNWSKTTYSPEFKHRIIQRMTAASAQMASDIKYVSGPAYTARRGMKEKKAKRLHEKAKNEKNGDIYSYMRDSNKAKRRERNEYLSAISENLQIPPDVACHAPIITIQGRQAIYIENHKKVLEYTDSEIKLQAHQTIIHVEGAGLKIAYCTKEEMKITGVIRVVSYH